MEKEIKEVTENKEDIVEELQETRVMKSKKKIAWQKVIGGLMILIGLSLVAYHYGVNYYVKEKMSNPAMEIDNKPTEVKVVPTYDKDDIQNATSKDILAAIQKEDNTSDQNGIVHIPSSGIMLKIFEGMGGDNLLLGAGTDHEGQIMGQGNYILASHHGYQPGILMSGLSKTSEGDSVFVRDNDTVYEYVVFRSEEIQPSQVDILDDVGKDIVTLYTCHEDGDTRWVVQGDLVDVSTYSGQF